MRTEQAGALLCRALGGAFLILAASSMLYCWPFRSAASTGWTSYSPESGMQVSESGGGTYFFLNTIFLLPSAAQFVAGVLLMLFSKPLGRLLARGLTDQNHSS